MWVGDQVYGYHRYGFYGQTCPNCGYCPHCRRSAPPVTPLPFNPPQYRIGDVTSAVRQAQAALAG